MLTRDELAEVARLKRLTLKNAERDYLQELLLFSLYAEVGRELAFKGGTCLYKLHGLNRFSEDLDFTLVRPIDLDEVMRETVRRLRFFGVSGQVKEAKKHAKEMNFVILLRGPLFTGDRASLCFIPVNVSLREGIALDPERVTLRSLYREIPGFEVFSMTVKEMLAEKVRAIFARGKPRDLYDLWFFLRRGVRLDPGLINRKLRLYRMRFDAEKFARCVEAMGKRWEVDLKNLVVGSPPSFEEVRAEVIGSLGG
jgi:predicted nucleotidyltransferase component of viral defense system